MGRPCAPWMLSEALLSSGSEWHHRSWDLFWIPCVYSAVLVNAVAPGDPQCVSRGLRSATGLFPETLIRPFPLSNGDVEYLAQCTVRSWLGVAFFGCLACSLPRSGRAQLRRPRGQGQNVRQGESASARACIPPWCGHSMALGSVQPFKVRLLISHTPLFSSAYIRSSSYTTPLPLPHLHHHYHHHIDESPSPTVAQ